jgi:hypothetical protein
MVRETQEIYIIHISKTQKTRYTFPPPYETKKKKKKMGGTRQLPL